MKKLTTLVLAAVMLLSLCACGKTQSKTEITVFAAASLTEALTEIGDRYMAENDVTIVFNFDSSGTLKTQISEGASCDIFISAAQKQMNELDCIRDDTRIDLLENKVSLVFSQAPMDVFGYDELISRLKEGTVMLAIGNSDVPAGQYALKIFDYYGVTEADFAPGTVTYGSTVKEVVTQIQEGAVDCGIVYATDAVSAGLTIADTATPEMCGQVTYPAAVMQSCTEPDAAQDFLSYLRSDSAADVFESVGFTVIK